MPGKTFPLLLSAVQGSRLGDSLAGKVKFSKIELLIGLFHLQRIEYYIGSMDFLIVIVVRLLETMFLVGLLGSLGVLLVSFVEDAETLFDMEDSGHS